MKENQVVQVSESFTVASRLFWVLRELSDEAMRRGMSQKQITSCLAGHGVDTLKWRTPRSRSLGNLQKFRDQAVSALKKKASKDGREGVVIFLWCEEKFSTFAFFPKELATKVLVLGYLELE